MLRRGAAAVKVSFLGRRFETAGLDVDGVPVSSGDVPPISSDCRMLRRVARASMAAFALG